MSSASRAQADGFRDQYPQYGGDLVHTLPDNADAQAANIWFEGGLPTPPRSKDMTGLSVAHNLTKYTTSHPYQNGLTSNHMPSQHSRASSDPCNVGPSTKSNITEFRQKDASKNNGVASYLQIPESINSSKGSITDFAAEITCLFWFESAATLEYAEHLALDALPDRSLVPDASPSLGFRKWVAAILSTTQVGKNVILLALMFIYRLKKFNPSVSGKRGSEFRLLTIALMLGNKFLDDNTYTNKTWAEVSGISVQEIHIMEVEFLSNMRYQLYASQAEWLRWKALLARFDGFYDKASRHRTQSSPTQDQPITPTNQTFNYKLPSPPSRHHPAPIAGTEIFINPTTTLPHLPRSPGRHQQTQPMLSSDRKRSLDASDIFPPAKRQHYASAPTNVSSLPYQTATIPIPNSSFTNEHMMASRVPQLPLPRIPTNHVPAGTQLAPLSLIPPRSMSTVYPITSSAWSQPVTPISALPPNVAGHFQPTPTTIPDVMRSMSALSSANTSPVNHYGSNTPTRQGLSPSYFLTNRSSPYRPVRNVHTLLIPPPSAAMQNAVRSIDFDQMHYQPLGRPVTDRRAGPVPFLPMQNSATSTPTGLHYRPF